MTSRFARRALAGAIVSATFLVVTALPAPAATSPSKWGGAFCGSLTDWADVITNGAADFEAQASSATPAQAKTLFVQYLDDATQATEEFGDALGDAGAPDVKNGKKIQSTILEGIAGVEALLGSVTTQASQLPTSDAAAFKAAAQPIIDQISDASVPFEDAMDEVATLEKKKELSKALKKVKACKAIL